MMRLLISLTLLLGLACGQPESQQMADMPDHSEHAAAATGLTPVEPAAAGMSLYQTGVPWTNQYGEQMELQGLAGRPQLVAMTYTSCEVSCPVIVADMKRIEAALAATGTNVGFVLLSLDPDRDTPARLAEYAAEQDLSERWTLLTAQPDDVLEMAMLLGVRYRRLQDGEYAHSNMLSVLGPDGVLVHQQKGLGPDLTQSTTEFLSQF
jgi:protein SCO1